MTTAIWAADYNDIHPPIILPGERTDAKRGLDVIRSETDPHGCRLRVIKTGTLNGRIDNHDPLWCLYDARQGHTRIRLLVITVNWGRGYDPADFKRIVLQVTKFAGRWDHVIIMVQELDEADAADEHAALASTFEPRTRKVGWGTHEPIVLSPGFTIAKRSVVVTMAAGLELDPPAPAGTGPTRHGVACIARLGAIELVFGNTHPHRNLPIKTVQTALARGTRVFRHQLEDLIITADKEAA